MIFKISNVVFKNVGGNIMQKILARIVEELLKRMSPEIREELEQAVLKLEIKAKATVNPWDDLLVFLLKIVLEME